MKGIFHEQNICNYIWLIIDIISNRTLEDFSALDRAVKLSKYREEQAKKYPELVYKIENNLP